MLKLFRKLLPLVCGGVAVFSSCAQADSLERKMLTRQLAETAPEISPYVLAKAVDAVQCAVGQGMESAQRLAVIDFSLASSEPRLWIFDLERRELVLKDFVAHGENSGEFFATRFSNILGSHQSSLGLFRAQETYYGKNGYSLRLDGLEPGFNDKARQRAIVIHGADYVDSSLVPLQGRIGRSQGCPAVAKGVIKEVVDSLKGGQFVFSYYPDKDWLLSSTFLNCEPRRVAAGMSDPRGS